MSHRTSSNKAVTPSSHNNHQLSYTPLRRRSRRHSSRIHRRQSLSRDLRRSHSRFWPTAYQRSRKRRRHHQRIHRPTQSAQARHHRPQAAIRRKRVEHTDYTFFQPSFFASTLPLCSHKRIRVRAIGELEMLKKIKTSLYKCKKQKEWAISNMLRKKLSYQ